MQLSFDGVSLMDAPFSIKRWDIETMDNRQLLLYGLARRRGGHLLFTDYTPKKFSLEGTISGASRAELDASIDEFKELTSRQSKRLVYEYAGGTRRLTATKVSLDMPRENYHITKAPFKIVFVAPDGVALDTAQTVEDIAGIVDLVTVSTFSVLGSVRPDVKLTITIVSLTAITSLDFLANGDKITLTDTFLAGDIIVINNGTLKVTRNGEEKDYAGIFPWFFPGANTFQIEFHGTAVAYDYSFAYFKTYS